MNKIIVMQTEQNILNVIAIKHFNIKNILILNNSKLQSPFAEKGLKNYLLSEGFQAKEKILNPYNSKDLESLSTELKANDILVIPNSRYAYSMNFLSFFKDTCKLAFVEEDGDIYLQQNGILKEIEQDYVALDVEDYIENFGGYIKDSSEVLFDEGPANKIFNHIMAHLSDYRDMLKPPPIKLDTTTGLIHLKSNTFNPLQKKIMLEIIDIMKTNHICSVHQKSKGMDLCFYNHDYIDFIGKVGTWLEMATYKALSSINTVDSPKSSVFFYWNKKQHLVSNEVDVMGTYDNKLILISCKDTGKNLEKALYELFVHGEQLGFDQSIKILVTTSEVKSGLRQRAKELGIELITFEKHLRSLTLQLKNVLERHP